MNFVNCLNWCNHVFSFGITHTSQYFELGHNGLGDLKIVQISYCDMTPTYQASLSFEKLTNWLCIIFTCCWRSHSSFRKDFFKVGWLRGRGGGCSCHLNFLLFKLLPMIMLILLPMIRLMLLLTLLLTYAADALMLICCCYLHEKVLKQMNHHLTVLI